MAVKELTFDVEARQALLSGVEKLTRAVKSTLGPRGRNAILDKSWGGPSVTKDGVSVAEEIELKDKAQNMGVRLVKRAVEVAGEEIKSLSKPVDRSPRSGDIQNIAAISANNDQAIGKIIADAFT